MLTLFREGNFNVDQALILLQSFIEECIAKADENKEKYKKEKDYLTLLVKNDDLYDPDAPEKLRELNLPVFGAPLQRV